MECWKGTAKPVYQEFSKLDAMRCAITVSGNVPADDDDEMYDQFYDLPDYELVNDTVYKLIDTKELDPYGFVEGKLNEDQSVDFMLFWYNGGGSRSEVLAAAIKKAHKEKSDAVG